MNWSLFYLTFGTCFFLAAPAFAALNAYGVHRKIVPAASKREWRGRNFVHWREETTLYIGDTFFLSLLDACAMVACSQVTWTAGRSCWALVAVPIGTFATLHWLRDATAKYNAGVLKTWGWHFCGRNRFSPAGWYHSFYFGTQITVGILALIFLSLQGEVNPHLKTGMVFAGMGYIATFLHHVNMEKVRGNV